GSECHGSFSYDGSLSLEPLRSNRTVLVCVVPFVSGLLSLFGSATSPSLGTGVNVFRSPIILRVGALAGAGDTGSTLFFAAEVGRAFFGSVVFACLSELPPAFEDFADARAVCALLVILRPPVDRPADRPVGVPLVDFFA